MYVFKYKMNKLWLYQQDEGETLGSLTTLAMQTSNSWTVLQLVMPEQHLRGHLSAQEDEEEQQFPTPAKRVRLDPPSNKDKPSEPAEGKIVFSTIWKSKTLTYG